ncbi:hypothetical protein N1851_020128 [Merluccius polli]|uniref:Reverse transcriptase domain-containing protein n=1 Tax=Merluccius polli TaxID=89951 RepID=A0AA47NX99_MERPO|nr:hypothetical protein N1851_020128 [Merluccius polli]
MAKFADDTVLISLLREEEVNHGPVVEDFVEWCDNHFLKLNVNKTKDMVIDFRKTSHSIIPTTVKGSLVDLVESYKYLGTVIDNKLNHDLNTKYSVHPDNIFGKQSDSGSGFMPASK